MITIRRTGIAEKKAICQMVLRLLHELEGEVQEFGGIDLTKIYDDMESCGKRFNAFLAYEDRTEPLGILTLYEGFAIYAGGNYGVIDEMYVVPKHRSQGIGQRLLEAAAEYGRTRHWMRIDVTAPPEPEWQRTLNFYEKAGFVFTGPKMRLML